jgi:phosphate transport system protein
MKKLEEEINILKRLLLEMAVSVEEMIGKSINALKENDTSLAEDVIKSDDKIDMMENEIEKLCIRILALYQPEAEDLRTTTMIVEINKDLERIGDHAVNIAERAVYLSDKPSVKPLMDIQRMAERAMEMLREALDAFVSKNAELALEVCKKDQEVDSIQNGILRELETCMIADPGIIDPALRLILVVRDLERIADLTKNIAEDVFYIACGKVLRHHAKEEEQFLSLMK